MNRFKNGLILAMATLLVMSITFPAFSQTTTPPASPVKLIFIHHSTGGHWLAASPSEQGPSGDLGEALMNNNYYVSATNYGWDAGDIFDIGSRTDVVNWPEWFTGPNRNTIMAAVYAETEQNISGDYGSFGDWPRLATNPGGENQIIMFKSCFPNSDISGNPSDLPAAEPNDYDFTVANFKAVYNNILTYFATRQDKLFVVITAPPMSQLGYQNSDSTTPPATASANARAFNNWVVNDWLNGYAYQNVAVFDYYNVLTSNGGDPDTNDAGSATTGNHHRWWNDQVQHVQNLDNNYSAYPSDASGWDDHPTTAGQQKATAEFVLLLNYFYNRWKGGSSTTSSYLLWTK